ncbi:hypothetical protein FB45DRAFT_941004 [Roridomyces roridus]|uniref:DUF6534 domain-containing protein n=1 Tax=Roridomyces roridus TaxID=1738132 RepID=A0AAD7B642_9AGAR|nr:hypothetical protein FB45DRAFT_941004 [Roridomyces roridus]
MASTGVSRLLAAMEIGTLVSTALFGVIITQAYIYYGRFPADLRAIRAMVAFVMCCEVVTTLCTAHWLYVYTISANQLGKTPWSSEVLLIIISCEAACVQIFFAYRIYKFSEHLFIPALCTLLSLLRVTGNFVILVGALQTHILEDVIMKWGWLFDADWGVAALNDLIIAGTLVYLLWRQRNNVQESPKTLAIIDRIIKWTLETGLLTSLAGIITLVLFVSDRHGWIWFPWWIIQGRLFAISLLASLNSRQTLRAMDYCTVPIPLLRSADNATPSRRSDDDIPAVIVAKMVGTSESTGSEP